MHFFFWGGKNKFWKKLTILTKWRWPQEQQQRLKSTFSISVSIPCFLIKRLDIVGLKKKREKFVSDKTKKQGQNTQISKQTPGRGIGSDGGGGGEDIPGCYAKINNTHLIQIFWLMVDGNILYIAVLLVRISRMY